jgi:4-hydroxy-tetrahydrodipicolinate reductase
MKIAVYGYGAMGRLLANEVIARENMELVACIEAAGEIKEELVFKSLEDVVEKIDLIIDFSHYSNIEKIIDYASKNKTALVIATTGHSDEQIAKIKEAAKVVPILFASNTSLGINLLNEVIKKIVPILAEGFDIELIEKHHNKKLDSPSGTAKTLLETINSVLEEKRTFVHGRDGLKKREKNEIGVHAVRGGTIVGEHSVIFAGTDEIIEIKHEAHSKKVFATGALKGAQFLFGKEPGLYEMKDVLNLD